MSTRNDIIGKCRASITKRYDRPSLDGLHPVTYEDTFLKFVAQAEAVGCRVEIVQNDREIDSIIQRAYPDAKVIAGDSKKLKCATIDPDTVGSAQELNGTDVGVVNAFLGVAENGCVWIPQTMKERDVCFISENLVAVLSKKNIVDNMHEAYALINREEYGAESFGDYGYGVFIAGPSKTADIAQVLVNGAQAARGMTLIITP